MPPAAKEHPSVAPEDRSGFIAGIAAFATWGLIPVYWQLLSHLPAAEILAHACGIDPDAVGRLRGQAPIKPLPFAVMGQAGEVAPCRKRFQPTCPSGAAA